MQEGRIAGRQLQAYATVGKPRDNLSEEANDMAAEPSQKLPPFTAEPLSAFEQRRGESSGLTVVRRFHLQAATSRVLVTRGSDEPVQPTA